jgi:hypothetical protein
VTRFLLLLALVLLPACDSDDGPSGSEVDGVYQATAFAFTPSARILPVVDVLDSIATQDGQPILRLDLFGQDEEVTLVYQLADEAARTPARGTFRTASSNRVIVDFGESNARSARLLLPQRVTFTIVDDGDRLTAEIDNTVTFEQLQRLDPEGFAGLEGPVGGRLELSFVRL